MSRRGGSQDGHRLAVLPLSNINPDSKDEYFAEGMTEELISTLSKISQLRVIARTSVMKYKATSKTIAEIGRELGVRTILEGSIRKAGNKVRIATKLVDSDTEEQLWSQTYDRHLEDVFAIQSDIAQRIARSLKVRLIKGELLGLQKKLTTNPEAYSLYLNGRYFLNKRTEDALSKATHYFSEVLVKDPQFAPAYSGLADSHAVMGWFEFVPPREVFPEARKAAEKALEIDPNLAEAHTSIARVRFLYDWDWRGAEAGFRHAIQLNPNYGDAHQLFAHYLKAMARFDEALKEARRAEELDPLSLAVATGIGHVLYLSRQYDDAIEQYSKAVTLDPNDATAHLWFGRPYLQKGMYKEAIAAVEKAVSLSGGSTMALATLAHAYAASGKTKEAHGVLDRLLERSKQQYVPSYWIALVHVSLGDKKQAFAWLERAFLERSSWLVWINVEPRFDTLRSDQRFSSLLSRIGLAEEKPGKVATEETSSEELGIRGWMRGPRRKLTPPK